MTQHHWKLNVDEIERQMWCKAWRLLVEHGDDAFRIADTEMERALRLGDQENITHWRQIADAVEQLAK